MLNHLCWDVTAAACPLLDLSRGQGAQEAPGPLLVVTALCFEAEQRCPTRTQLLHQGSSEGCQVLAAAVQGAEGKNAAFPHSEPSIQVFKGPLNAWLLSEASQLS